MTTNITPIVKWAGGKTQLLREITSLLPTEEITIDIPNIPCQKATNVI